MVPNIIRVSVEFQNEKNINNATRFTPEAHYSSSKANYRENCLFTGMKVQICSFFFLRLRTQKILPNILDHIHFFKKFISFKEVIKRQLFTLLRSKTLISPKKLSAIKVKFDLLAEIHLPKPSMYINVY